MIEPKAAVEAAATYFRDITGDKAPLYIEEIELSEDKKNWNVTLSHPNPSAQTYTLLYGTQPETRLLKAFKVDAISGQVLSMRAKKIS